MFRTVLAFFTLLFSVDAFAQCDVTSGLLHRYELNGNTNDMVGTKNTSIGAGGYAYVADRFGNANSAINITNSNRSLTFSSVVNFLPEMTMCFWTKITAPPANGFNLGRVWSINNSSSCIAYNDIDGTAASVGSFGIFYQNQFGGVYAYANPAPAMNEWHFVCITKQDTIFSLYIDNQLIASQRPYYYTAATTTFNALLGREGFATNPTAQFDDFRIYNRALSGAAMDTILFGANPVITKQPVGQTVCPGLSQYLLTVQSNISHLSGTTYQWYKNGTAIFGATNDTLILSNFLPSDSGNYHVIVANFCGVKDTSDLARIQYNSVDLNTNLVAYYAYAGNNPNPSNFGSPMTASTLQSGIGISFGPNRWGSGSQSLVMGAKQSGLMYQTPFNDSTSTISLWYKYNSLTTSNNALSSYLLGVAGTAAAKGLQSTLMINPMGVLGLYNGAFVPSTLTLSNGVWYHIVVVRNGANAKIYVDKNLVLEVNNAYNLYNYPIKYLGNTGNINNTNSIDGTWGTYEDVRFYNEALSEEFIYYLFSEMHFTQNIRRITGNTTSSAPQTICDSSNVQLQAFTVSSNTTSLKKYKWLKNGIYLSDNANYTGTQTSTLNINYFTLADTGTYDLESSIDCYKVITSAGTSLQLLHSDTNSVQILIDSMLQPLCTGQFAKLYFHTVGNSTLPANQLYMGASTLTSPLLTLAPNTSFTFHVIDNGNTCKSSKVIQTLAVINPLTAAVNTPLFSGDSLIIKTNASANKPNFSWNGPAGTDNDSIYNKANVTSLQSGIYTVTATNANTCTLTTTVQVTITPAISIAPKIFLSGPYSTVTGLMHDSLRAKKLIPLNEPYSLAPYNTIFTHVIGGGETIDPSILNTTGNDAIVDWVFVELRDKNNASNVLATKSALVQRDGDVVDARNGVSPISFTGLSSDDYFVSIRHRNHLGIMTKFTGSLSETPVVLDLTTSLIPLHRRVTSGQTNNFTYTVTQDSCTRKFGTAPSVVRALYSGNANIATTGNPSASKVIRYNGAANDRLTLLSLSGASGILTGYYKEDLNMNGEVKYNGSGNDRLALLQNVGAVSNTVYEQLPD